MNREKMIRRIFDAREPEGSCQAGQDSGMSIDSVVTTYFSTRNSVLKMMRLDIGLSLEHAAAKLGVRESELEKIENSAELPPHGLVATLAEVYGLDLKVLMVVLGMAKEDILKEGKGESKGFCMAAQYSGPELSKQDKVDLEEVFRRILDRRKDRGGK